MRYYLKKIIVVFLLLIFTGCNSNPGKLSPLEPDDVVLAFGDSLTYGTGAGVNESYPAVLEKIINRKVINAGIPGEVSARGLQRLPVFLDKYHPDLLILCHGANDILRRMDEKAAIENIKAMIRLARSRNIDVVLLGVPKYGLPLAHTGFYEEIAEEFSLPYDNEIMFNIIFDPVLKSDRIHPNANGYKKIAEVLAELLKKNGAL